MKKQYAVISKLRMQVSGFVNKPQIVNSANSIIVDLNEHPQKDEVEKGWFYNAESNSFSEDGVIVYPTPEYAKDEEKLAETDNEPTQLDRIEAKADYIMMKGE